MRARNVFPRLQRWVALVVDVEDAMHRTTVEKRQATKWRRRPQVLPLDPRDPDILHAKAIQERYLPPRRRAA